LIGNSQREIDHNIRSE